MSYANAMSAMLGVHAAHVRSVRSQCPPCNQDCNQGRSCPARARSMGHFTTSVAGIPCQVKITHFSERKGTFSPVAEDPETYYGHCDVEWELLDSRGYAAGRWLTDKLTRETRRYIDDLAVRYCREEREAV